MNYSSVVYNPNPHKYGPGINGFLTLKKLRPLVRFEVAVLYRNALSFCFAFAIRHGWMEISDCICLLDISGELMTPFS